VIVNPGVGVAAAGGTDALAAPAVDLPAPAVELGFGERILRECRDTLREVWRT